MKYTRTDRTPMGRPPRRERQSGIALICVLVCMSLATLLLAGMLRSTLMTRRQLAREKQLRQTNWLVEAGAARAAFYLERNPQYVGETWNLNAESIASRHPGAITITVLHTEPVRVTVTAEYPLGSVASIRRTRDFFMDRVHTPATQEPNGE